MVLILYIVDRQLDCVQANVAINLGSRGISMSRGSVSKLFALVQDEHDR